MSTDEYTFQRYSRQVFIENIGVIGQKMLLNAKVVVVGAGGLGSPVIQYLAAAGIGRITIVDHDQVEIHNLNRQVIHSECSVGMDKVDSAKIFVSKLNSGIEVEACARKVTKKNVLDILKDCDVVVDGSDNFTSRYIINDACVQLGLPLVYGSIFGYEGQLAVFNYKGSKQLRDIFPEPPKEGDVPDCDSNGVLGPLPGIIGSMMAMQTIKIIAELPVDTNQLTIFDTLNWNWSKLKL